MAKIDDILKIAQNKLNEKRVELEKLEYEKKDIISRFNSADEKERILIEEEMKESEAKYNKLLEEVKTFNAKAKQLKRKVC